MIFCHDKREYMTLGEYMEKYPIAYAKAVESMTAEQKALFAERFEDRYIYLPKDETSDTGENFSITTNGENCSFTPSTGKIQARGSQQVFIHPATNYKWNGTLTVTGATAIKNVSGSYITLVNPTGDVTVSATCDRIVYPLTVFGINCTPNPKPTQIAAGGTLAITYTAAAGYDLPEASGVGVTGCSFGWNQSTGVLTLYNPTGAVAAGVVAVAKSYAITSTVTNGTATGANVIHTGETVALTIAANTGYNLPDTVTVTGASQTWNKETGTLTLSNPTGAVTVSAVCAAAAKTLESGTYKWADNLSTNIVTSELDISFSSYGNSFVKISIENVDGDFSVIYHSNDDYFYVYQSSNDPKWIPQDEQEHTGQTIILSTNQTVSADFYNWAITGGNLVKQ